MGGFRRGAWFLWLAVAGACTRTHATPSTEVAPDVAEPALDDEEDAEPAPASDADVAMDGGEDVRRRLHLDVGPPNVESGSIPDAERQLLLMKPALRTCYELWGRSSEVLTMEVSVTLDSKGKVDASGVKAREPLPRDLRDCIQSVLKRTRFQAGDAKSARLSFSLSYVR